MTSPTNLNNPVINFSSSGNATIEALTNTAHYKWSGQSISYSLPGWSATGRAWYASSVDYDGNSSDAYEWDSWSALNASQRTAAQRAFAAWGALIPVQLVEVTETSSQVGDLRVAFSAAVGVNTGNFAWGYAQYPWPYYPEAGDIWIDSDYNGSFQADGAENYNYYALLHEIGHAMGLKHPFDDGITLPPSQNDRHYTLMSYTDYSPHTSGNERYWAQTPMVLDIDAIQAIYGINQNTATGNDRYTFSPTSIKVMSIWDAAGTDTLDGSAFSDSITLDLRGGHYSSLGRQENIGLATRTVIENAVGGSGNDTLTGNSANNQLTGGPGNDTLNGGEGQDTAIYPGKRIDYAISQRSSTEFTITYKATGEQDQLTSIETAQFADTSLTLNSSATNNDDYTADINTTGSLTVGASLSASIDLATDHDWFAVTLIQGASYLIRLQGGASGKGTLADPLLILRNAGGTLLTSDDDSGYSTDSELTYQPTSSGKYFLDASSANNALGSYSISLTQTDDYPANSSTAGQLQAGGSISGSINTAGDTDWLAIPLTAGNSYRFTLQGPSGSNSALADPLLTLRDASGQPLASNDDYGTSFDSQLDYVPNRSGTYYLDASSATQSGTGNYTLSATQRQESDIPSSSASTSRLPIGGSISSILDQASDIDWFVLDLDAGSRYRFAMRGKASDGGTLLNPNLAIRNLQGVILASDDDSGTGADSQLDFTAGQSGRYYLDASASGATTERIGSYTVSAQQLSYPDNHDAVYRFARTTDGKYLYTASAEEKTYIGANYPAFRFEGAVFYAEKAASTGYLPVYRYANTLDGGYFYTTSEAEKASIARSYPHLRAEGISFYVPQNDAHAHAVYRLANTSTGGYLFTASDQEHAYALSLGQWRDEGIAFSAFTTAQTDTPLTPGAQAAPGPELLITPDWQPASLFDNGQLFGGL